MSHQFYCRACTLPVTRSVVDLGTTPLCQTQIEPGQENRGEMFYPLHAYICDSCMLVQLDEYVAPSDIFSAEYPYFSSFSDSWVAHAKAYVEMAAQRFNLSEDSLVVELASNDGYLLQHFVAKNIPCFGVEPAASVAEAAVAKGIPTEQCFFGSDQAALLCTKYGKADLILGNNVLAHVPALNDFVAGMGKLLAKSGVITMEFPHLLELIKNHQFDTIYHEHFSYFSLAVVETVFARHGLQLFDVEQLSTHGGSIRIFACHEGQQNVQASIAALKKQEQQFGLNDFAIYQQFADKVKASKRSLLTFLINAQAQGKQVAGYGAPGKGNTLLNYCGIGTDLMRFTVDRSPHKYGRLTPGSRIPIFHPDAIFEHKPDYILILPWNLEKEITAQLTDIKRWGGQAVIPIPEVRICE